MRLNQLTPLLGGCCLIAGLNSQAQERVVDASRQPYNMADGLFRGWPQSGEWVTHNVTLTPLDGSSKERMYIMQSELIQVVTDNGDAKRLHWFEVTFREDERSRPIYVLKLLVDLNLADAGEWNLGAQKSVGWLRNGDAEPVQFTEQHIHDSSMLQSLVVLSDDRWQKLDPVDVAVNSGKLRCHRFRMSETEDEKTAWFECQLHPSIPFGCVRFSGELQDTFRIDVRYAAHGTGARTDLPHHDYRALMAELANEPQEK